MIEDYFIRRDVFLEEVRGDPATVGEDYVLVNCISRDLAFCGEVSRRLDEDYRLRPLLIKSKFNYSRERVFIVEVPVYYYGEEGRLVIANVVTKEKYWEKPTYESVGDCFLSLRSALLRLGMRKAAFSVDAFCEGCLDWREVKKLIYDRLKGSYMSLRAYT